MKYYTVDNNERPISSFKKRKVTIDQRIPDLKVPVLTKPSIKEQMSMREFIKSMRLLM